MKVEFVSAAGAAEILVVLVHEDRALVGAGADYDKAAGGALSRAMTASRFTGKSDSTLVVSAPTGIDAGAVVLSGLGDAAKLNDGAIESAAGSAYHAAKLSGATALTVDASALSSEQAARIGFATRLAAYRFDKYLTKQKPEKIPSITTVWPSLSAPSSG